MKGMNNTPWPSFPSVKDKQDTLIKKVERLCILGVLKQQQASNWALPSFIVPNKNETIWLFRNYWEVTRDQLGNLYWFPKTSMVLHELTSLMQQPLISIWATITLRLDQAASKICAIILPSWGSSHKDYLWKQQILLTSKLLELMESQEDVWACPMDLLCISWGSLEDQVDCSWRSLDSLDGFLSNVMTLT